MLTLIQTEKVSPMPILLYRSSYWQDLVKWINAQLLAERCISPKDLDLFRIVDSVDEAVEGVIQPLTADGTLPVPPAAG